MGAWIEIRERTKIERKMKVALFMGAWIEIFATFNNGRTESGSLSSWERGLKCFCIQIKQSTLRVALFMGAWIEISHNPVSEAGNSTSLSSWERGLKYQ